jgi:hypothetical protein
MMRHRMWIALPLSLVGMLSAASSGGSTPCGVPAEPSRFDYVVLASMADSQHPISMASYRPQGHGAESLSSEEPVQFE